MHRLDIPLLRVKSKRFNPFFLFVYKGLQLIAATDRREMRLVTQSLRYTNHLFIDFTHCSKIGSFE